MSDEEELRPKRAKRPPKHECTVILLDVGSNMEQLVPGTSVMAIHYAKEIIDWILTRKIFTESPDEFVLVLFGSDETKNPFSNNENIFFCEEEMQVAKIDWLKLLEKEIKPSKATKGDFLAALIDAANFLRTTLESAPEGVIIGSNILLVSNLGGDNLGKIEQDFEDADAVVNGVTALGINFNVIGPSMNYWAGEENVSGEASSDSLTNKHVKMEFSESMLSDIVRRCKGVTYSFTEALPMLRHFVPRRVTPRGQRFLLEISEEIKLPLLMYKKIQPADMKLKFKKVDVATNAEIKRETVYEKVATPKEDSEVDKVAEKEDTDSNRVALTKEDIIKGYTFGATIVPFNEADKQEYGWRKEIRSMRLMQFAKRKEILQHYLMDSSAYYCLPPADDQDGCVAVSSLVRGLIAEDCVVITRYVYNAASQPRLLALFPRTSKKGVDLPYYEDFRGLEFPSLEDAKYDIKADQKRAIEALVYSMDLSKSYFDPATGEFGEDLRPKNVPNPKLQRLCEAVKLRALHPGKRIPQVEEDHIVEEVFRPRPQLVKLASEPLSWIAKSFTLHDMKKANGQSKDHDEMDYDSLPGFGDDESTLPDSGHFIPSSEIKKEEED